jgi:hypothetical protein
MLEITICKRITLYYTTNNSTYIPIEINHKTGLNHSVVWAIRVDRTKQITHKNGMYWFHWK